MHGGIDVANGYNRVVPDGESLWLELTADQIFKTNFRRRWKTRTRQYFAMPGVTLHQQLAIEKHPYPRRNKLAVKIDRGEPCSRLEVGKYYLHVHQIKIYNPELGTRWLGTRRLIQKLVRAFGCKYHPKQRSVKPPTRAKQTRQLNTDWNNPAHIPIRPLLNNWNGQPNKVLEKPDVFPQSQHQLYATQNLAGYKPQFPAQPGLQAPVFMNQRFFPLPAQQGMG